MNERWLAVPGFEGRYEVSDLGNVRSLVNGRGTPWLDGPRPVAQHAVGYRREYLKVNLWRDNARVPVRVHRAVAFAFIGPPLDPSHEVLHGPRGSMCNEASNLSWGSHLENCQGRAPAYTWGAMDCLLGIPPPPPLDLPVRATSEA